MRPTIRFAAAVLLLAPFSAVAAVTCADVQKALGASLADVVCFASADLTTNNPQTTPADNSLPGLPFGAFTPTTDRTVIAPSPGKGTPITKTVPGIQLNARIASDPTGQARFLLRLPNDWNGRLVIAGASGTRSEFNGDFAWSDYVVQKGYAYASQNKGVLNLRFTAFPFPPVNLPASVTPPTPRSCRLNPSSLLWVEFFDNDDGQDFTRWAEFMIKAAELARDGVKAAYGRHPRFTYAVGTSNGGYQVRRAIESAPELFDGGVDWEGTFVDEHAPNLLTDLPPAILNFPDYTASTFNPASTSAKNIRAAGYPPDIVVSTPNGPASLWGRYSGQFWEVTQCQWQKRLDPTYDTYGSGTGTYNYIARLSVSNVGEQLAAFATTGKIQRPLVTVAGTMDALLPIDHHARAYARKVAAAKQKRHGHKDGDKDDDGAAGYRLYEVQNGNHIETFQDASPTSPAFPQLELIEPHAQRAFDFVVDHVESGAALPPDQCIPRGGSVADLPAQPGHCASLFVP